MKKGINEFYKALGGKEAHGDYKEFNDYDYLGKYQMGEAALVDTEYYVDDHINYSGKCDWKGTFTGKDGVYSREDFLSNPQAQENANREYKKKERETQKEYLKSLKDKEEKELAAIKEKQKKNLDYYTEKEKKKHDTYLEEKINSRKEFIEAENDLKKKEKEKEEK